jgi:TolA-binding protein
VTGRVRLVAVLLACGLARPATGAPVDFPLPDLPLGVTPLALNVTRPALDPPPAPALPPLAADLGAPPPPRFDTRLVKPAPPARDPGGTACTFAFGRAGALADCGIHRALHGDAAGARSALQESIDRDPRGAHAATAYLWLGELAFAERRADEAERRYRTALAMTPPAEPAVAHVALALGWLAVRRGDTAEAERVLAQVRPATAPPAISQLARFLEAMARLLAGRPPEAARLWDAVAAAGPPPEMAEELLFWRGVTQARLGQADAALGALDSFLAGVATTHPLRADAMVQSGWIALDRGAHDDALRRFLWAHASSPRPDLTAQIRAGLARTYLALGDASRARDAARLLAVEAPRDPGLPRVLLLIGEDALARQATAEAVDILRQLLGLAGVDPRLAEYATYRLAEGLERQGALGDAERYFRGIREKGRVEAIAQRAAYRLGLLALRAGRPADARTEGEGLLQAGVLDELREPVLLLTAEGAARGDDANRAVALFRLVLRDYPGSSRKAAARLALGWAMLKDGDSEAALREWEEARLSADVDVAVLAHLALAEVALRQGHEAESQAALAALARLAPAHPLADTLDLNRGVLLIRAKAYEPAVQVLEPLAARIAGHADRGTLEPILRRALGIARYHLEQPDVAEREFARARHWAPAEYGNSLGEGLAALSAGRWGPAERALGVARLAPVPEVAIPAAYGLVVAAVRRDDDQAFRERATAFVSRYPTHAYTPMILYEGVRRAIDGRDFDQADVWLSRLLQDAPKSEVVPATLVMVGTGAAAERPQLARRAWTELLAHTQDPGMRAEAWLGLAEAGLAVGDVAAAPRALEAFLQEARPADPRAPRALALLIDAQDSLGRRQQAIGAAEGFLARFPADPLAPAIRLRLGHYLLVEQKWDEAQQALEAARDAGDAAVAAPAQFYLGELLRSRGQHEAAIGAYLGASYLYPDETPWATRGMQGAVQSYLARQMPREASILLRKLLGRPGLEPDLARWARDRLARLGPITGEDPAAVLKKGPARP